MIVYNQYTIFKDGRYLNDKGKLTTSLERAKIFPTKVSTKEYTDKYGGEVIPIYLSLQKPQPKAVKEFDKVWLVKYICQIKGLALYGPFFSIEEAQTIYNDKFNNKSMKLFEFTKSYELARGEISKSINKLGDELILCEVTKV